MNTSADHVMATMTRYCQVADQHTETGRQVRAAVRRINADKEFHAMLVEVLEQEWPGAVTEGSKSVTVHFADCDPDILVSLSAGTGSDTEQLAALQVKITDAAGPDPAARALLGRVVAAAIGVERSSFGEEQAHQLRAQTLTSDIAAIRDLLDRWPTRGPHDGSDIQMRSDQDRNESAQLAQHGMNPAAATTALEFLEALRLYRVQAGKPAYRDMARRARTKVAASTMVTALNGVRLPSLRVVIAVVTGCGGSDRDLQAFLTSWRRINPGLSSPARPTVKDKQQLTRLVSDFPGW